MTSWIRAAMLQLLGGDYDAEAQREASERELLAQAQDDPAQRLEDRQIADEIRDATQTQSLDQ
jgi:hypothetical protein